MSDHGHIYLSLTFCSLTCDLHSNNKELVALNVLDNDIGILQAQNLASVLREHAKLKSLCGNTGNETELNMSKKKMGVEGAIMLAPEIIANTALTSLNISNNGLGARDVPPSWFKEMDSDGNGELDEQEFVTGMTAHDKSMSITQATGLFKQLDVDESGTVDFEEFQKLDLKAEQQQSPGALQALAGLWFGRRAEALHQKKDNKQPLGIIALSGAIRGHRALTSVNIRGNEVDDVGKQMLGDAFRASCVKFLEFDGWSIAPPTADDEDIAFTLQRELPGSEKEFKPSDAILLAGVIRNNRHLSSITFDHSVSSAVHGREARSTLHCTADKAAFGNKALNAAETIILAAFLPRCSALSSLDLSSNKLTRGAYKGSPGDDSGHSHNYETVMRGSW